MENRINQIITLNNGDKYMILHQAIYNNKNYYVCCGVTEDEEDTKEEFYLFEENKDEGEAYLDIVQDENLAKFILEHLNIISKDEK